jgi:hypothetical protein
MKIVNIEHILNPTLTSYSKILTFFAGYTKEWYDNNNIYCEKHHILPKCEGGKENPENLIYLPLKYHFLAHFYRAEEFKSIDAKKSIQNYIAANFILGKRNNKYNYKEFIRFKMNFPKETYIIKQQLFLRNKDRSYEQIFGLEKGRKLKENKRGKIPRIAVFDTISNELYPSISEALRILNITKTKLKKLHNFQFLDYNDYLKKCEELKIQPVLFNLQRKTFQYNKGKKFEDLFSKEKAKSLKENLSQLKKEQINEKASFWGHKHSSESKQKISKSRKGKGLGKCKKSKKHLPFKHIPTDKIYVAYMEAVREHNISRGRLVNMLARNDENWRYVTD